MAMRFVFRFSPWALSLLVLLSGCGPSRPTTLPVSGVVLLDGKPVEGAAVIFSPLDGGRPATGITDTQGRFRLRTFDGNDGALLGEHQVAISKKDVSGSTSTPDGLAGPVDYASLQVRFLIPQRYSNRETSGLTAEVGRRNTAFTFELSSRE